jgi:formylglycine-generating enzyme required for sulfatase activity
MFCEAVTAAAPTVYDCEGYRLPTDAEWEYAARAGTQTAFYSGPITCYDRPYACSPDPALEQIAWYCHNAAGSSHEVGQLRPNGWGLHDMTGNVFEWINDRSDGLGAQTPVDPDGIVGGYISRNQRGGSFFDSSTICRNANQLSGLWYSRYYGVGFRLARTLRP